MALLLVELLARIDNQGFQLVLAVEEAYYLLKVFYAVHQQVVDYGSLAGILPGYYHSFEAQFAGLDGYG